MIEELKAKVAREHEKHREACNRWGREDRGNNMPKPVAFKKAVVELSCVEHGVKFESIRPGIVRIAGKFYYAPTSGRWSVNQSKWYWSKNIDDFIERYVLK